MNTDDTYHIKHINKKLAFSVNLHSTEDVPLSVMPIHHQTGDLLIQFTSLRDAEAAILTHPWWGPMLDPSLCLEKPFYPVIVHGIPTSFNPENKEEVSNLQEIIEEILDLLETIKWVNRNSIDSRNLFSSLLFHLRHPDETNKAIKNRLNFFSTLKVGEKMVHKHRQWFICQGIGHLTSRCTAEPKCPTCDDQHKRGSPCKANNSPICVNCTKKIIAKNQKH